MEVNHSVAYPAPQFFYRHWHSKLILTLPTAKRFLLSFPPGKRFTHPALRCVQIRVSPEPFVELVVDFAEGRTGSCLRNKPHTLLLRNVKVTYRGSDWWVREGVVLAPGPLPSRFTVPIPTSRRHWLWASCLVRSVRHGTWVVVDVKVLVLRHKQAFVFSAKC